MGLQGWQFYFIWIAFEVELEEEAKGFHEISKQHPLWCFIGVYFPDYFSGYSCYGFRGMHKSTKYIAVHTAETCHTTAEHMLKDLEALLK